MSHQLGRISCYLFILVGLFQTPVFSTCNPCGPICTSHCKVEKGCILLPERTQQFFTGSPDCEFSEETVPAASLYFRMQGKQSDDKATVVFIHGLGEASDVWLCAQEELCNRFLTVAIDLRGFGRSDKTPAFPQTGGIHYTTQLNVDDVFEVLSALGITKNIILVGHSLGVNYAIKYASLHQNQLSKLVLVAGYPFIVPNCAVDANCATSCFNPFTCETGFCNPIGITVDAAAGLTAPLNNCLNGGGTEKHCLKVWGQFIAPIWYNESCQKKLKVVQKALVKAIEANTVPILNSVFFNGLTEDLRPLLPGITVPTLICFGNADIVINPDNSRFFHEQIPHSILAEFDGKGHQLHVTDYKNFNRLLKKFCIGCPLPDFINVDHGCCICPLVKPINYAKQACSRAAK